MPHPDYLLSSLTSKQLNEWEAYDAIEPVGQYRNDVMLGQVAAVIIDIAQSAFGKKGVKHKPTDPAKLIPWMMEDLKLLGSRKQKDVKTPEQVISEVKSQFGLID